MDSIYHNLEHMCLLALHLAEEHDCNYNVIVAAPLNDKFDKSYGSTYEMVMDSYLESRPDTLVLMETDIVLYPALEVYKSNDHSTILVGSTENFSTARQSFVRTIAAQMGTAILSSCKPEKKKVPETKVLIANTQIPELYSPTIAVAETSGKFYDQFYSGKSKHARRQYR